MNSITPSVSKCFHLFGFSRNVVWTTILYITARRGPLEIRVELYAVRRIDVDALYLAAQPFALR